MGAFHFVPSGIVSWRMISNRHYYHVRSLDLAIPAAPARYNPQGGHSMHSRQNQKLAPC